MKACTYACPVSSRESPVDHPVAYIFPLCLVLLRRMATHSSIHYIKQHLPASGPAEHCLLLFDYKTQEGVMKN